MSNNSIVGFQRFFTKWFEPKGVSYALNHCRFACTSSPDKNVKILVEMDCSTVQKATFPCHRNEFGVLLWNRVGVQADSRLRVKERLP